MEDRPASEGARKPEQILASAHGAVQAGAWSDALRLAGSLLAIDPLHSGALEVIAVARRALESSRAAGAERRQMTILFADVVGSTMLVADLGGELYRELILLLHEAAARWVSGFGGRIAQYLGDGILAYFSYPHTHEDDAQRAIHAGLGLLRDVSERGPAIEARFGLVPKLRVGIDSGRVVIGAAGAGEWTTVDSVFGEAPHVAARLQSLAPANAIVISDATRRLVERFFVVESLGERTLTGYPHPVHVYRVLRPDDPHVFAKSGYTMVGREDEAKQIEAAWANARAGAREEVHLAGEAGVGKSRLVEHLANVAAATGGRVITFQCSAAFRHSAFHPVTFALRRLVCGSEEHVVSESKLRAMLAGVSEDLVERAVPTLLLLLGEQRSADMLPEQLRAAIFDVIVGLLDALAATLGGLLVVFEDIHTADESTLELLQSIRSRAKSAMLIVATSRSESDPPRSWNRSVTLKPLSDAGSRALVASSGFGLDEATLERILSACGGLPLFLIDSARLAKGGSSIFAQPSATTALLTHRLNELDPDERLAVSELAVLGTASSYALLASLSELPGERLDRALARLLHGELLVAMNSGDRESFGFRHLLYQDAAYDAQLSPARERRHSRCADALIQEHQRGVPTVVPELIANHLSRAARSVDSIGWWQLAGERAANTGAHVEANVHWANALKALQAKEAGPERDRLELLLQLSFGASTSSVAGYSDASALQAFTRAAELGSAAPNSDELLPALWGIWSFYFVRSAHDRARAIADRCVALAEASASDSLRAFAAAISGAQHLFLGNWSEAAVELERGCRDGGTAAQLTPQDSALASRATLAVVHWVLGDGERARLEMEAAIAGAAALSGRQAEFTRAYVYCYAAWLAQLRDDASNALQHAQQALEIAQRHNFVTWLGAGYLHLASALSESGDLEHALPIFEQSLHAWQQAGAGLMMPYFQGRYARALMRAGRHAEALQLLNDVIEISSASGEAFYDAELRRLRAEALANNGAPAATINDQLEASLRISIEQRAVAFEVRARDVYASRVASRRISHPPSDPSRGAKKPEPTGAPEE